MKKLTQYEVLELIRAEVKKTSLRGTARRIGVSAAYLQDVIRERRPVSENVGRAFGFEREIVTEIIFRKIA